MAIQPHIQQCRSDTSTMDTDVRIRQSGIRYVALCLQNTQYFRTQRTDSKYVESVDKRHENKPDIVR